MNNKQEFVVLLQSLGRIELMIKSIMVEKKPIEYIKK